MLRRKPTAITITAEDITAFEEAHARRMAYLRYRKTGEDPDGLFRDGVDPATSSSKTSDGDARGVQQMGGGAAAIDPNDELKPLPGDKARIVRGREERIMGTASGAAR
jgi:hypothetical protein